MNLFFRGKLWIKLFLSFTLIILVSGGLIMGITIYRISDQFQSYVKNGDIVAARGLAPFIGRIHEQAGGWEALLNENNGSVFTNPSLPRMRPMNRNMENNHGGGELTRRIVITDLAGLVTFDSEEEFYGEKIDSPTGQDGILVFSAQEPVGRLYLDSMVDPALNPLGKAFVGGIQTAVSLAVWPALLLALGVTLLIVRHITRPLNTMKNTASKIAGGDLSVRTGVVRRDELGELARAFDDMAASLEAGEEWKRRIIADSAHELRTPVTLIQGNLEMMIDGVYPLEIDRIKSLYEETLHLTGLISSLQELAGLEADVKERELSSLDLPSLAEDVAEVFRPALAQKSALLQITGGSFPEVKGNYGRMKQVFLNLFTNAARYIPEGGRITVDFTLSESSGELKISVSNNGPAIPAEDLEKIFERFYRVDKSRNSSAGGRGLGLAICSEILKNHGGRIEARNLSENEGVSFNFYLPV